MVWDLGLACNTAPRPTTIDQMVPGLVLLVDLLLLYHQLASDGQNVIDFHNDKTQNVYYCTCRKSLICELFFTQAKEKEEKKLKAKAKAKEAARLQAQAASDGPKKSEKKQRKKAVEDENPEDFIDPDTPHGQKKFLASQMAKQYSPAAMVCLVGIVRIFWGRSCGSYFEVCTRYYVLPPPNVTGALHIGHALTVAIEDAIIRWRRMSGYNALWVPGVDHAGIATQVVVEKKLMREKKLTRHDIGREEFVSEVLKWKDEYGGTILNQLRRLGASLDWSRERDYRLVNWDCTLRTAISDVEVDYLDIKEETMLKITPAHDPNDFEVGKRRSLEFINIFTDDGKINNYGGAQFEGMPRFTARVAVIEALKAKGLYKETKKNEMCLGVCSRTNDVVEPMIKPQWFVNCNTMAKAGIDAVRSKRIEIIPQQYEQDWYRWLANIHDWCVSRQLWWGHRVPAWYVVLEDDQENILGSDNDRWVVARNESEANLEAHQKYPGKKFELHQDPDVLDTWFSSGLFPLTVLGWPDDTADVEAFYPGSVLETGHDILFFWVARMVMMGMQLGGDVPFQKVYLHPMIRDAHGRKMSKSLGNVIDPVDVINGIPLEGLLKRLEEGYLDPNELNIASDGKKKDFPDGIAECGTDALRFALSDKINLDIKRVVGYRQWCNKLWNAIRFAMGKLGNHYTPPATISVTTMPPICKWILSVLNKAIGKTVTSLEAYKSFDATSAIYSWWQYQLCDVFIEAIKPYFFNDSQELESARAASRDALRVCLDTGLRLLHPFMPYVTEELWQRLPQPKDSCRKDSIMVSEYPSLVKEWADDKLENQIDIALDTVNKLRSLKPPTDTNESCCEQSLSVYLQLQGALNAEVELEKLRKKREEIQKLQHALSQKMEASGYKEKAPHNVQEEDMRKLTGFLEQLEIISEAEKKLDAKTGKN
uniref:valine--tRNA ligase n=1 Tax=Oryza barthii TaxID=65489 RepID=A0A0D3FCW2_9ORYZ